MKLKSSSHYPPTRSATFLSLILLFTLLTTLLLHPLPTAQALEATFTPNPNDAVDQGGDGGPLPLSMNQRKQLLELEVAIVNSQDPAATLAHVAQQNGMSQQELAGMLDRNRRDLQETGQLEDMVAGLNGAAASMGGGGGGGGGGRSVSSTLPRRIVSLLASIFMGVIKSASVQVSKNPKQSTLLAILLISSFLAVHNAPKNGIVVSTGSIPPFSGGHTSILMPPVDYMMQYYVDRGDWENSLPPPVGVKSATTTKKGKAKKSKSIIGGVGMTKSLSIDTSSSSSSSDSQVIVERSQEEGYTLITTAHKTISLGDGILKDIRKKSKDDKENGNNLQEEAMDCMHEAISSIFDDRKFSEFIPEKSCSLKFRSFLVASEEAEGDDEEDAEVVEGAVMALKLLGDFGRYGIQPLCFSYEEDTADNDENEEEGSTPMLRCVAFHSIKGGHFDGEIRFSMEEKKAKKKKGRIVEEPGVIISVTLAIPQGGRAPPARLADLMVSSMVASIAQSSEIRMKQTLARRRQSKSYRANASGRASEKRHLRYEQEKNQEEMAAERKRRWKRNNPDAGHYRPSGHRLRSPNNC